MLLTKECPNCEGSLKIWHATIYRTFDPKELTVEKLEELNKWIKDVVDPGLAKILESVEIISGDPNTCPHCNTRLGYLNRPVAGIKPAP